MVKHPGFKSVQSSIAKKEGVSKESAGAILASASRNAGKSAKAKNPRLNKVLGKMHDGGVIPQDGLYEMEKGEHVTPNHGKQSGDGCYPTPPAGQNSPNSLVKKHGRKRFDF